MRLVLVKKKFFVRTAAVTSAGHIASASCCPVCSLAAAAILLGGAPATAVCMAGVAAACHFSILLCMPVQLWKASADSQGLLGGCCGSLAAVGWQPTTCRPSHVVCTAVVGTCVVGVDATRNAQQQHFQGVFALFSLCIRSGLLFLVACQVGV